MRLTCVLGLRCTALLSEDSIYNPWRTALSSFVPPPLLLISNLNALGHFNPLCRQSWVYSRLSVNNKKCTNSLMQLTQHCSLSMFPITCNSIGDIVTVSSVLDKQPQILSALGAYRPNWKTKTIATCDSNAAIEVLYENDKRRFIRHYVYYYITQSIIS